MTKRPPQRLRHPVNKGGLFWLIIAGIGVAVFMGAKKVVSAWKSSVNAQKYIPVANAAEVKYGLPHDLIARMAYQESHFRDDIINGSTASPAGALGIMQIVPKWHPTLSRAQILDPYTAIPYAASYVKSLYTQFGTWDKAVAAYNAGPGNVTKYAGVPPFAETLAYVKGVLTDIGLA